MKKILLTSAIVMATASIGFADGLTALGLGDPEVMAPASVSGDWTGPYVGLSYGRNTASSTDTVCSEYSAKLRTVEPLTVQEPPISVCEDPREVATEASSDDFGAFVGYRKDWGRLVGGVELGVLGDMTTLEAQAGLDLGKVLAYGAVGFGDLSGESGEVYSVGADMQVGKRVLLGVKYTQGSFGSTETETTSLRVGLTF